MDATGAFDCSAIDRFLERARTLGVEHRPPEPIVKGRHLLELGVEPGPRMGEILRRLYEQQLDGHVQTIDEGLHARPSDRHAASQMTERSELEMNRAGCSVFAFALAMTYARPWRCRAGAREGADRQVCR